jgi:hypothetical protein
LVLLNHPEGTGSTSRTLLVGLAPPVSKEVAPVHVATASGAVVKGAHDPTVWFYAEEGAVPLQVVCSATFITGQMVEGRGGAALTREVPRTIAAPAAQLVLAHAGVFSVISGVVMLNWRGEVRGDILGSNARCRRGRLVGVVSQRSGELLFCRGVARMLRDAGEVTVGVQLQLVEISPSVMRHTPVLANGE